MKIPTNIPASVRQRLLSLSRTEGRPFHEVLQYYAMERFLYRLTQSPYTDRFILKGALMLRAWQAPEYRPTMDIDMLGQTNNDEKNLASIIREIIVVESVNDGLEFFPDSVETEVIKEGATYHGVRIQFRGKLDTARIKMQIDVSFDDIIYPGAELLTLPLMLNFPKTKIWCYNKETVIAEKFETIVSLGYQNSRIKDFFDIWLLSHLFDFDGKVLSEAIRRTFEHREASVFLEIFAFNNDFASIKQTQWNAFIKKLKQEQPPKSFSDIMLSIQIFLKPIVDGMKENSLMPVYWQAPGPWK